MYRYEPADNGAGPLWCSGSTCLARIGDEVYASGLETLKDLKPLNNCRWQLFQRHDSGWKLLQADATGRTREPCPLAAFPDGRLFLSANPTLTPTNTYAGPARPEILQFRARDLKAVPDERIPALPPQRRALGLGEPARTAAQSQSSALQGQRREAPTPDRLLPVWDGNPQFTEHSYRSLAADGPGHELILFQNIGYTHAEWAFCDSAGAWSAHGKLLWPQGSDYPKPEPIRVCYPDVALRRRAVHFCGVSDIVEPYPEWRAFKKQLTGQEWDYDFRRLFYTWTPDITRTNFQPWIGLASRDKTCGWISPGDLWLAPDGTAHVVWTERAIDERLRAKFFPQEKQRHELNYAVLDYGQIILRRTLLCAGEDKPGEVPSAPRFQVTPDNRLFLVFYVQGTSASGKTVSENRVMEILRNGETGPQARIPFHRPFTSYFTATVRAGSPPSATLELLGQQAGAGSAISYARIALW